MYWDMWVAMHITCFIKSQKFVTDSYVTNLKIINLKKEKKLSKC